MENDLKQKIEERLAQLPSLVRDAVLSDDTGAKIRAISAKHQLHVDQGAGLEDTTMLVMLGFIPPEKFSDELERQLLVDKAKAAAIVTDIEAAVFLPIREHMKSSSGAVAATMPPQPIQPTPSVAAKAPAPSLPLAHEQLTQKTSAVAPIPGQAQMPDATASQKNYKTDPYREPIE